MNLQSTPDEAESRSNASFALESLREAPVTSDANTLSLGSGERDTSRPDASPSNTLRSSLSVLSKNRVVREYALGEEITNSITHGLGIVFALGAIPFLAVRAVVHPEAIYLVAALVYAYTLLLEYTMSTLYHAIAHNRAKKVFKVLDHSCIYLLIAGSYTPFCLITLANSGGVWLCVFVWALALAGVISETFWVFRPRWISAVLYLLMGWCIVWFVPPLLDALWGPGLWLLVGGGVCYTIGCIFYLLKKIPYMHSVFHLWVLAGTLCQFWAIAFYVL